MAVDIDARHELVLAIAHEMGNHLGGIRLEAHLLGDDLDPRELARASVTLDGLASRSGSLLSLIRPLLRPGDREPGAKTWSGLLAGTQQELLDQGTRGVELSVDLSGAEPGSESLQAPPVGWLHPLLMAWLGASIAQVQAHLAADARDRAAAAAPEAQREKGHVRVALIADRDETRLVFEDSAPAEDLSEAAPRRERPLALAIARVLLGDLGGRVEVETNASSTEHAPPKVVWHFPNAPSPSPSPSPSI